MAPAGTPYDEDKHFLMLLVLNAGIQITQACEHVAPKMGPDVKAERLRGYPVLKMVEWNEANERLLLLALLNRNHQGDWDGIVKAMGGDFTTHGVRQKFYKLKRESEQLLAKAGVDAPATPSAKKTAAAKPKATPKSTGKGRKRKADAEENGEEGVTDTPSKKSKNGAKEDTTDEHIEAEEGAGEEI